MLALAFWIAAPSLWMFATIALLLRVAAAWTVGTVVLRDPLLRRNWWLLPLEEIATFAAWVLGFFGKTILWRGRRLVLARDGSLEGRL